MLLLGGLGALLGVVGGLAAYLVVHLVGLISNVALLHRVGFDLPNLAHYHPGWVLVPIAMLGGLVVAGLARWSPVIKGHGIPESIEAILQRQSRIAPRTAVAKPISAAIAMGTGGPFGAEGPIIVTGGAIGSLLGQLLPVSPAERRILLATGAAAGMAGVFATPVAAVLLAIELLLFERSLRALLPLVLATGIATALHDMLIGPHPLFAADSRLHVVGAALPLFLLLGVACGLLAVVLSKGLSLVEAGFARLPVDDFWHPVIGAAGFALVGLVVPGSLSVGYWAITDAVNGRFLLAAAAALFVAKTLSWWVALGSNTSGGTLAPIFLIAATMGEMIGIGLSQVFPGAHLQPAAFALVAMGATFAAASRALLTGAVFALEVTGAYHLVVPMLLAAGVAELVAEWFLEDRIMTERLSHRGLAVDFDTVTDPLAARTTLAGLLARRRVDEQVQPPTLGWSRSTRAVPGDDR
ncbi:MAG: chloride channel protein [Actinomycetes bacterium]